MALSSHRPRQGRINIGRFVRWLFVFLVAALLVRIVLDNFALLLMVALLVGLMRWLWRRR